MLGPVLVNYLREYQIEQGVPKADAYTMVLYIMAGILILGFIFNALVKPVHERHHLKHDAFDECDGIYPSAHDGEHKQ